MRVRYIIGVFTGSIIFGGLAYGSYHMDAKPLAYQTPATFKTPHISKAKINLAELSQEFPTRKAKTSKSQHLYHLARLNLFSSGSNSKNQSNNQTTSDSANNQQQSTDTTKNNTGSEQPGFITNKPQENTDNINDTNNQKETLPSKNTPVNETYIPANSKNVPVDLPEHTKKNVSSKPEQSSSKSQNRSLNSRSGRSYYQSSRQQAIKPYEYRSFQSVPTPVYFSPDSVYSEQATIPTDESDKQSAQKTLEETLEAIKKQQAAEAKADNQNDED